MISHKDKNLVSPATSCSCMILASLPWQLLVASACTRESLGGDHRFGPNPGASDPTLHGGQTVIPQFHRSSTNWEELKRETKIIWDIMIQVPVKRRGYTVFSWSFCHHQNDKTTKPTVAPLTFLSAQWCRCAPASDQYEARPGPNNHPTADWTVDKWWGKKHKKYQLL